jgi:hypothetical protein
LTAGRASLHVCDLASAECDHLEALPRLAVGCEPAGRSDDDVVADLLELRLDCDSPVASLFDLESQDLTGLVGAVSRWGALPPEMTVRHAAPLGVFCEERGERFGVAAIERLRSLSKLLEHRCEYDDRGGDV